MPTSTPGEWTVQPIGVVHSPFLEPTGTPVQPAFAGEGATGTIEVFGTFVEGLSDIEGFERIWVLAWLDRSKPARMRVVPFLDDHRRGLFSTRSPNRPNPIGISALRLLGRAGGVLEVADLDLLDGTPVLDIKPYAQSIDVFPGTGDGWLTRPERRGGRPADGRFSAD
jgi:tRNA-Thr(GGU) m(6)t(6)A37 methyltransferase TsaA